MVAQPPTHPRETRQAPTFIRERFTDLAYKVRYPELRKRIWTQLLTEEECQRVLHSNVQDDMVQIWSFVKNVSLERAVIDLARKLGFLFPDEDQQLLEYVEPQKQIPDPPAGDAMPSYRDGKLWLGNECICTPCSRAGGKTRKEILFMAFEKAKWKKVIKNPFKKKDRQSVYKALQDANSIGVLRFRAVRGASHISWEIVEPTAE